MNAALTSLKNNIKPRIVIIFIVAVLLGAGFGVRMVALTNPPFDFHPDRQLMNAITARGMYYQLQTNADPDKRAQAIASWKSQEVYEPPILPGIVAVVYRIIGGEYIWVARVLTSLFWILGGLALFLLVKRFSTSAGAVVALAFYLFQPFGITASRAFQVDPLMVMAILWAAWGLYRWGEEATWRWALAAGLLCGLAILIKVTSAYVLMGMALAIILSRFGLVKALRNWQVWVVAALSGLPPLLFYIIGSGGGAGQYFSFWTLSFARLLLQPSFYGDLLKMINSLVNLVVFFAALAGVFLLSKKGRSLVMGFWAGYVVYMLSFPFQITTHDYYHLQLIPLLALSLPAWGELAAQRWQAIGGWFWRGAFIAVIIVGCGYPIWLSSRVLQFDNYSGEAMGWQHIGEQLPSDGRIIGLVHAYGYPLIYYGWREVNSWPLSSDLAMTELRGGNESTDFAQTFQQRTHGFRYFLVTLMGELDAQPQLKAYLADHYQAILQDDGLILYDLATSK
jgi:Dolichyl-phosphate-mannose-protein mannosyltransferase